MTTIVSPGKTVPFHHERKVGEGRDVTGRDGQSVRKQLPPDSPGDAIWTNNVGVLTSTLFFFY